MSLIVSGLSDNSDRRKHADDRTFVRDMLNSICRELKGSGTSVSICGYLSEMIVRIISGNADVLSPSLSKNLYVDPAKQADADRFWSTILTPAIDHCYAEPHGLDEKRLLQLLNMFNHELLTVICAEAPWSK